MANMNLLAGLAGFAQGFAPSFNNARTAREQLLAELEAEKKKRMQQESAESFRWMSAVPGVTLPEGQEGAEFMGQTVDDPGMRSRALQIAEMMQGVPSETIGAGLAGPEGMGPYQSAQTVLSPREASLIPGAKAASQAKRKQSSQGSMFHESPYYKLGRSHIALAKGADPLNLDRTISSMSTEEKIKLRKKMVGELNMLYKANNLPELTVSELEKWADILLPNTMLNQPTKPNK